MTEAVEAVKSSLRQSKDGLVVSFVVHPNDDAEHLLSMPIGQRVMLAVAPIESGSDTPASPSQAPAAASSVGLVTPAPATDRADSFDRLDRRKPKVPFDQKPLSQQAAILCRREDFHAWAYRNLDRIIMDAKDGEIALKDHLDIRSFTQLDDNANSDKRDAFIGLVEQYEIDSGLRARP